MISGAPMVSLRGPALGPLMSLLEAASANSRLHLGTIRPDLRQSGQDLGSLPGDHPSTEWNVCERSGIVDCNLSVISGPEDQPNRKSEIIERWRRGSERREENPQHQVNTAVAMKIIPRASTVPTPTGAPQDIDY